MNLRAHRLLALPLASLLAVAAAGQGRPLGPASAAPAGAGLRRRSAPRELGRGPRVRDPSGVLWRAEVPGLGHSSPIVWGDRVYVCTAVPEGGVAELMLGKGGQPTAANDERPHRRLILCFQKRTGEELRRRIATRRAAGHPPREGDLQANSTLACDGERLVACLGSEGLHCFDLDGSGCGAGTSAWWTSPSTASAGATRARRRCTGTGSSSPAMT